MTKAAKGADHGGWPARPTQKASAPENPQGTAPPTPPTRRKSVRATPPLPAASPAVRSTQSANGVSAAAAEKVVIHILAARQLVFAHGARNGGLTVTRVDSVTAAIDGDLILPRSVGDNCPPNPCSCSGSNHLQHSGGCHEKMPGNQGTRAHDTLCGTPVQDNGYHSCGTQTRRPR